MMYNMLVRCFEITIFAAACLGFFHSAAWAQNLNCSAAPAPLIQIFARQDPVKYNLQITQAQLNMRAGGLLKSSAAIHGDGGSIGGLTEGLINSQMQMEFSSQSQNGITCIHPSKITVNIKYQPTILIPREYPQGSCNFRAVLQHEAKHVRTDQGVIRKYIPVFKSSLTNSAGGLLSNRPFPTGQTQAAAQQMEALLKKTLDNVMKTLSAERETLQTNVDTPGEYARVQSLCSKW